MTKRILLSLLTIVLASLTLGAPALSRLAAVDPTPAITPAEIEQLVKQLGDRRYAAREKAQQTLWKAGRPAEEALRKGLKSGDAEVARRARQLLDKFEWGIYPDTPPAVLALIERYRDGDEDVRRQSVAELVRQGAPGLATLVKLRGRAVSLEDRRLISEAMTEAAQKSVPALLIQKDTAAAEALLEASLAEGVEEAIANYVALILLREKMESAVSRWEAEAARAPEGPARDVLAALARARGDYPTARKYAGDREPLLESLLWEQGDWKELARRSDRDRPPVQALALKAAYLRKSGDAAGAERALAELAKLPDHDDDWSVAKGMLLNEKLQAALDRLSKPPAQRAIYFDLLAGQLRYKEALALAEKPLEDEEVRGTLRLKQAKVLFQMGERDAAVQLLSQLAEGLKAAADTSAAVALVQAEVKLGLKPLAREHAARYFGVLAKQAIDPRGDPLGPVLDALYPKRGGSAKLWWNFLRQKYAEDDAQAIMRRLHELLEPANPAAAAGPRAWAEAFLATAAEDDAKAPIRLRQALAVAYEAAGQWDAARDALRKAAELAKTPAAWQQLGDLLLGQQKYAEAARAFESAWKLEPSQPLPLYLAGWCQTKAGERAAGEEQMELAFALSLGNIPGRAALAEELARRDLLELAQRERAMIQKLGWGRHWYVNNYLSSVGREAALRKDHAKATEAFERIVLGVLASDFNFVEASAYLAIPALVHAHRARAALAAGQLADARQAAAQCLALTPGNIDLAILLVPELERKGQRADAEALFRQASEPYEAICRDYPKSPFAHNAAAWLAACCRRNLDAALGHARAAVEIAPQQAGYRDTLAEVHFQRGETDQAIAQMRECLKLEPRRAYFARQLKRFEQGQRDTPPPEENDEE